MIIPPRERLILTLNTPDYEAALETVDKFSSHIDMFRVRPDIFIALGSSIIEEINERGKKVFLDLKVEDIPNSIIGFIMKAAKMGVHLISISTSIGAENMKKSINDVNELCEKENVRKPTVIGETVLTSVSPKNLKEDLGIQHSISSHVTRLSELAQKAGIDGVIVPPRDVARIRKHCGNDFLILTAIRPSWSPPDAQQTEITPKQALRAGADYLVLRRTLFQQDDPVNIIDLIKLEILSS